MHNNSPPKRTRTKKPGQLQPTVSNLNFVIRSIVYDTGKNEIICMNTQQYSGFMRRKGIRKSIIANTKLFAFSFTTKNYHR